MTEFKDYPPTHTWTKTIDDYVYVECPECKSSIRLDAHLCRYCHSDVDHTFETWRRAYPILLRRERRSAKIRSLTALVCIALFTWATIEIV